MSVYTVHEPPPRAAGLSADPEDIVFIRDGFYWWAFLLAPFWMLWNRLWLVLVGYVAVSVALQMALRLVGAPPSVLTLVAVIVSLLIGLEAGTLRRFTLRRSGWSQVGIVSGADIEDAERRFFTAWAGRPQPRPGGAGGAAPSSPVPAASVPHFAHGDPRDVIGLFPEPGAQR
jgi:hypothetical protein